MTQFMANDEPFHSILMVITIFFKSNYSLVDCEIANCWSIKAYPAAFPYDPSVKQMFKLFIRLGSTDEIALKHAFKSLPLCTKCL